MRDEHLVAEAAALVNRPRESFSLGPDLDAGKGFGVGPVEFGLCALGTVLLAVGLSGFVPPREGFEAVGPLFRYLAIPWLLPGLFLTFLGFWRFRNGWCLAEQNSASRRQLSKALDIKYFRSTLDRHGNFSSSRYLLHMVIGVGGLFEGVFGAGLLGFGTVVVGLAVAGEQGPGVLLIFAAVAVAGAWVLLDGSRRFGRRAIPELCMETKRPEASVWLHRRLEFFLVLGLATGWLITGSIVL